MQLKGIYYYKSFAFLLLQIPCHITIHRNARSLVKLFVLVFLFVLKTWKWQHNGKSANCFLNVCSWKASTEAEVCLMLLKWETALDFMSSGLFMCLFIFIFVWSTLLKTRSIQHNMMLDPLSSCLSVLYRVNYILWMERLMKRLAGINKSFTIIASFL